jgi:hypothetical protein
MLVSIIQLHIPFTAILEFINNMKAMRKRNDEIYQLAKDQALVKRLKNKRFRHKIFVYL